MTDDTRALAVKQKPVTGTYQEPGSFPTCDAGCVMCRILGERPQQKVTPRRYVAVVLFVLAGGMLAGCTGSGAVPGDRATDPVSRSTAGPL